MIRRPLRPLARILQARARGENPDVIERDNLRQRNDVVQARAHRRARNRLLALSLGFCAAFGTIAFRLGALAAIEPAEVVSATAVPVQSHRADILDRQGRVLATNLVTHALYAHPKDILDPPRAARELAAIFPDLDADRTLALLTDGRSFVWLRRKISPEQMQAVHDIGEPGLLFAPREVRLYPNGTLAAHVLGGAGFGAEGVASAEVIGVAGLERTLDARLRDPARIEEPVRLTIDIAIQAAVAEVLGAGMTLLNAKGASAIIMEAQTGAVVAMVSLPDFDPNNRPRPAVTGEAGDSPLFNRAVQGVYELGSVMKVFPVAQALELGLVNPDTKVDTRGPMMLGRFRVRDFRNYGSELSVTQIIVKSSNIGTARLVREIGAVRQEAFLKSLGFLDPLSIEVGEAPAARPLVPKKWGDIASATISYGHGLSASPMHLASAYATLVNGGIRVTPTLLADDGPRKGPGQGPRILKQKTSDQMRAMLRATVVEGTATMANVAGYAVGGKTGTADKILPGGGGYAKDKVMATFAGAFPMDDPQYVIVVSLDEPVETSGTEARRTAGWTAVPVTGEIIRRIAPLLGLRPTVVSGAETAVTRVRN